MKIKGPTRKLSIRKILQESRSGKGIWVQLISGVKVCLPKNHVDFQIEDWGGRVAVIPLWLKKKIDKELNYDGSDTPPVKKSKAGKQSHIDDIPF